MNLICFILGQVRQEDPENVLVSSLAYLTRTKALYGGDLEAVVTIMRTVASRIQYRLQSSSNFHDKVCKRIVFIIQKKIKEGLRQIPSKKPRNSNGSGIWPETCQLCFAWSFQ